MKIKLHNRDRANMYLYRNDNATPIEPNIYEWKLTVDDKHEYVLKYCRYIMSENNSDIEAIDPSGGPFISLADELVGKYKIVKINSINSIWISERDNN